MEDSVKIFTACMDGRVEVVQQLIAEGVDLNEPRFSTKCTPLHLASISGKRRVLKLLLRSDALIDTVDKNGRTALHHAVARANMGTARDLIKFKADVNVQATDLQTPLALAAYKGCSELVQLLLERAPPMSVKYIRQICEDPALKSVSAQSLCSPTTAAWSARRPRSSNTSGSALRSRSI